MNQSQQTLKHRVSLLHTRAPDTLRVELREVRSHRFTRSANQGLECELKEAALCNALRQQTHFLSADADLKRLCWKVQDSQIAAEMVDGVRYSAIPCHVSMTPHDPTGCAYARWCRSFSSRTALLASARMSRRRSVNKQMKGLTHTAGIATPCRNIASSSSTALARTSDDGSLVCARQPART